MSSGPAANDVGMPLEIYLLRALSLNTVCGVKTLALFCWENHQIYACAERQNALMDMRSSVVQQAVLTMLVGISEQLRN